MSNAASAVSSRLEADRRALLDLSLRNPLLNYRPRARGLEIMGESPAPLFQTLVREGKRMSFLPAPGTEAGGPLAQPEETSGRPSVNQADLKLQTALPSDLLQSRLLAIFHAARTSLEEQGVNTLFLALGMLRWSERDEPRGGLRAPLLLIPVELERSQRPRAVPAPRRTTRTWRSTSRSPRSCGRISGSTSPSCPSPPRWTSAATLTTSPRRSATSRAGRSITMRSCSGSSRSVSS